MREQVKFQANKFNSEHQNEIDQMRREYEKQISLQIEKVGPKKALIYCLEVI